jgi:hypothetical protein
MKRFHLLVLMAGCTAQRITHMRSGWNSCQATDPNTIRCGGQDVAQVECFHPGDEACGALAIRYADGERVFLFRPFGFEAGQDDSTLESAVIRPELASDGSKIWYRAPTPRGNAVWTVYEPQTGITQVVDSFQIFRIRERDPHSLPLWVVAVPK